MKKIVFPFLLIILLLIPAFSQTRTATTRKAGELMSKGDLSGAMKILDEAISKQKDLLEVYKMRSFIRSISGNTPGAVADMDEAVKINPSDPELYARRGKLKIFLNDATALDDFDNAIANGYKSEKVFVGRAMVHRNQGDLEKAEADYRTAYGLNPMSARAVLGLSSILQQQKNDKEALAVLQNFIFAYEEIEQKKSPKINTKPIPGNMSVERQEASGGKTKLLAVGSGVTIDGNPNMSVDEIENYLNTSAVYTSLADLQIKNGLTDTALINIEKALRMNASDSFALSTRGKAYMEKEEFQKALDDYNKSIDLMPNNPTFYIERGIIYLVLGNKVKAQKDFDKYVEIFPRGKSYIEKRIKEAETKYSLN